MVTVVTHADNDKSTKFISCPILTSWVFPNTNSPTFWKDYTQLILLYHYIVHFFVQAVVPEQKYPMTVIIHIFSQIVIIEALILVL